MDPIVSLIHMISLPLLVSLVPEEIIIVRSQRQLSSISILSTVPALLLYCHLNVRDFDVMKLTAEKAELKWSGFDDPLANYHYEAQVSRDGHSFITIGSLAKNNANDLISD